MFNNSLLKTTRNAAKLSQVELASMTGISQADISLYERGLKNPSTARRDALANALNCPALAADIYVSSRECPSCGHRLI